MATFDISPLFRTAATGLERPLDWWRTGNSLENTGFPAYNIVKVDDDAFRISLSLPGIGREDITIEAREGEVTVKGGRKVDPEHNRYLYKGFDIPEFQRTFRLPEHVQVKDARLDLGMLHIELVREVPEQLRPRRIEITSAAPVEHVTEESSRAA